MLAGNPGHSLKSVEAVAAVTSAAEQRLDLLPERLALTLRKWVKAQAGEAYSFEPSRRSVQCRSAVGEGDGDEGQERKEPMAESRQSHASFAASDETPALPWGRKKGGKTPPLLGQTQAGLHNGHNGHNGLNGSRLPDPSHPFDPSANLAHANGHEMDRGDEAFQGGDSSKVRNFDGDDICGRDSFEFAIPTPTSGSDFQGSPELSVRASGDFYQQGRAEGGSDGRCEFPLFTLRPRNWNLIFLPPPPRTLSQYQAALEELSASARGAH